MKHFFLFQVQLLYHIIVSILNWNLIWFNLGLTWYHIKVGVKLNNYFKQCGIDFSKNIDLKFEINTQYIYTKYKYTVQNIEPVYGCNIDSTIIRCYIRPLFLIFYRAFSLLCWFNMVHPEMKIWLNLAACYSLNWNIYIFQCFCFSCKCLKIMKLIKFRWKNMYNS